VASEKITKLDSNTVDNYTKFNVTIPINEFDVVYSFLRERMQNKTAAENFTSAIFQIAKSQGVTVQEIIASLNTQNKLELSASIAMYLNEIRKPTTLLGVTLFTTPNPYAARNVLV
jgi:two-component SAPR family response regulator